MMEAPNTEAGRRKKRDDMWLSIAKAGCVSSIALQKPCPHRFAMLHLLFTTVMQTRIFPLFHSQLQAPLAEEVTSPLCQPPPTEPWGG